MESSSIMIGNDYYNDCIYINNYHKLYNVQLCSTHPTPRMDNCGEVSVIPRSFVFTVLYAGRQSNLWSVDTLYLHVYNILLFLFFPKSFPVAVIVYTRVQVERVYKSNPIFEAKNTTFLEKV